MLPSNRENEDNGRHAVPRIRLTASIATLHNVSYTAYRLCDIMTDARVERTRPVRC